MWASNPSTVRVSGTPITPALFTSTSTVSTDSANLRTLARWVRSRERTSVAGCRDGDPPGLVDVAAGDHDVASLRGQCCRGRRAHTAVTARDDHPDIDPAWVHNLRANPRAHIEVGTTNYDVIARELPAAERDELYPKLVEQAPVFAEYQSKTSRVIPLFELDKA